MKKVIELCVTLETDVPRNDRIPETVGQALDLLGSISWSAGGFAVVHVGSSIRDPYAPPVEPVVPDLAMYLREMLDRLPNPKKKDWEDSDGF